MTILQEHMPLWDARRVERRVVPAHPSVVMDSAMTTDFLDAVRRHPLVGVLFTFRSAAERMVAFVRRKPFVEPPTPAQLRLADLPSSGEWVRLGLTSTECAFGVIGRFWAGVTEWLRIDASEFAGFARPGFARIACHLHVAARDDGTTVLSYEARTAATDSASRRAFRRYWTVVSPFVGVIMRATLAEIARRATAQRPRDTVSPPATLPAT